MKSWKMRLVLVLTMLAMVLAVSIPAMANNERDDVNRECFPFCNGHDDNDRHDFDNFRDFCDDNDDCDFDRSDFRDFCDDNDDCDFEDLGLLDSSDFEIGDVQLVCGDNDGDGSVDEDTVDGLDNDLDGLFDEDENLFECDNPLLVAELDIDD